MPALNLSPQPKTVADAMNATNMQVSFEYVNGVLTFVILKQLPLSSGVIYKVQAGGLIRPLELFKIE